jgi:CRP-like cAMP-binding protein
VDIAEQLAQSQASIFKGVAREHLDALVGKMTRRVYNDGDVLCEVGDEGDSMFLIVAGRLRIYLPDESGHELTFRYYEPFQTVGEIALLDHKPRSASVAAAADLNNPGAPIEVMVLHRDAFGEFLNERPAVGLSMMLDLTARVRYTTTYLGKITEAVGRLLEGEYDRAIQEVGQDPAGIQEQHMIAEFIRMVQSVQRRQQGAPD